MCAPTSSSLIISVRRLSPRCGHGYNAFDTTRVENMFVAAVRAESWWREYMSNL
jgi:hypothetical protein